MDSEETLVQLVKDHNHFLNLSRERLVLIKELKLKVIHLTSQLRLRDAAFTRLLNKTKS